MLARPCNCDPFFRNTAMSKNEVVIPTSKNWQKAGLATFCYVLTGFSFAENVGPFCISMWNFRCEIDVLLLFVIITSITDGAGQHTLLHDINFTILDI